MASEARPFEVRAPGGNVLRGESAGEGPVVLQAHGITAARRYVTHGSHLLERRGLDVGDVRRARSWRVRSRRRRARSTRTRRSRATWPRWRPRWGRGTGSFWPGTRWERTRRRRLRWPSRTGWLGSSRSGRRRAGEPPSEETIEYWAGLGRRPRAGRGGGLHRGLRRRLAQSRVARRRARGSRARAWSSTRISTRSPQALREVTASVPFDGLEALEGLEVPTLVVASHDEADPGHPWDVAVEWTERIPERADGQRGRGRVAARLAGRQALPRDRGVLRGARGRRAPLTAPKESLSVDMRVTRFSRRDLARVARRRGSPCGRRAGGRTRSRRSRRPCCRPGRGAGRPRAACPR